MITCVNLAITDNCNRSCPECCCNVPRIEKHWNLSLAGLKRAAKTMNGIKRVTLTGGEPTIHPRFNGIAEIAKGLFGCESLELSTNGYIFDKDQAILEVFDKIIITSYTEPEFVPNYDLIKKAMENDKIKNKIEVWPANHTLRSHQGTRPCARGHYETVSLYKDKIYPCCTGWGIEGSQSIELCENWISEILKTPPPCNVCFLAD